MSQNNKKEVVIIAGANGSGKTTFARKFLDVTQYEFLNADEFAKEMSPEDPTKARIAAGKKVISSISKLIEQEKSFVIESTLAGSYLLKYMSAFKESGYEVTLVYVYLGSTELCINRIKSRVAQGGHNVPDSDVVRRFNRGVINFWDKYSMKADNYAIYFNNEIYDFKLVAYGVNKLTELGVNSTIQVVNEPLYQEFKQKIQELKNG